jgi:hypothetical protein
MPTLRLSGYKRQHLITGIYKKQKNMRYDLKITELPTVLVLIVLQGETTNTFIVGWDTD